MSPAPEKAKKADREPSSQSATDPARAELERDRAGVPTEPQPARACSLPDMPDPVPLLRNLARCAMEAMAGARDLEQLARWVSDAAYKHLLSRVVMAARARDVIGQKARRPTLATGTVIVSEPEAGILEAVVIVHDPVRTRAVAIRLEAVGARWRASAINIL